MTTFARTSPKSKNKKITPDIRPKTHPFRFCCARKVPIAHRCLVLLGGTICASNSPTSFNSARLSVSLSLCASASLRPIRRIPTSSPPPNPAKPRQSAPNHAINRDMQNEATISHSNSRATKTHAAPQFQRAGAKRSHFPSALPGSLATWLPGVSHPLPQLCQISKRTQSSVPKPPKPPAAQTLPRRARLNIIRTRPPPADSLTLYPGARTIPRPRFLLTNPRGNACKI
jgi:hypothetical protein